MKKIISTIVCLVLGTAMMVAQNITVHGVVTSNDDGEPIVGASVMAEGTQQGTTTDINGRFVLANVAQKVKTLIVSYIGMETQKVAVKPQVTVALKSSSESLDEVIVTAFGTAKKSAFTGSAVVVESKSIEKKQVSNVLQALQGEVTGLEIPPSTEPGKAQSITIRGKGSINAGTAPLIVVDGMPYEGGINNLNPADVESISVLKDAASNALYGSRGANGVIIVTTKKGKAGKAVVNVDAKWGFNQRSTSDYDRIDNPGQYYEMYYKALYNNYISNGMSASAAHARANKNLFADASEGGLVFNVYNVPNNEYLIGKNGRLNPNATLGNVVTNANTGQSYMLLPDSWTDETYQTGLRQEYNVSISGGNDKGQTYVAFGYLDDNGIVPASSFERYNARLKSSYKVKPWMTVGANAGYAHINNDATAGDGTYSSGSVYADAANMAPIYPVYLRDAQGRILLDSHGRVYDYAGNVNLGHGLIRPNGSNSNSLGSAALDQNSYSTNQFNADGFVDVSFLNDFKFTFKAGAYLSDQMLSYASNPYYGTYVDVDGYLFKSHDRNSSLNLQQLLNWTHSFGSHNVSALVGHESYMYKYNYLSGEKQGAADYENNKELGGWLKDGASPYSYKMDYNTEGFLFRGMYDYDNRYFASVSFRRDASSRFHPDHRWGNFWSVGGAWIVNKEEWFKVKPIDILKLKASFGQQGNDQIGDYRYVDTYYIGNVNGEYALNFKEKGNKDITWETNSNLNIGVEFEMFKRRLTGSVEFYNRVTSDMLMQFSVPSSLGYSSYYKNVGDLRNRGVEIALSGAPIRTKTLEWTLGANVTFNSNKVTRLADGNKSQVVKELNGSKEYPGYENTTSAQFVGEGLPLGTYYMAEYAGVSDEGLSQWYYTDADGNKQKTTVFSSADRYVIKSQRPAYGAFSTSLSAYGFDVSAQFIYSIGGKGYDYEYAQLMSNPTSGNTGFALHKDLLNAWSAENTGSDIPRWQYNDVNVGSSGMCSRFLIDNSYLSFQNVQVGYTMPAAAAKHLFMEKVRFYVTADNIYLWTKRKGYDPRLSNGYGAYSPMRAISGGVSLQF